MFAATRTPPKKVSAESGEKPAPVASKVRKSIGEWEAGRKSPTHLAASKETAPPNTKDSILSTQGAKEQRQKLTAEVVGSSPPHPTHTYGGNKVAEARACLNRAKLQINSSKNTKTEIKVAVIAAVDRLFQLVKESEADKKTKPPGTTPESDNVGKQRTSPPPHEIQEHQLLGALKENTRLIIESNKKIEELKSTIDTYQRTAGEATYASVAAGTVAGKPAIQAPLHSMAVTSDDTSASGEEIIEIIRKAVNAREGDIAIDKVRKAKDRKIIIGCRKESELRKVAEKIKEKGRNLKITELKNKDPQIVLYNVLKTNTDEDIVDSIRRQNKHLIKEIQEDEQRMEVRFRRNARNPHTSHVVMKVSPQVWQRLTQAGAVLIDLQRIRVADQSPLIQCSRCLGFGHGRKHCSDAVDVCSHCGGQHLKAQCAEWFANTQPSCVNCVKAKAVKVDHNAFGAECPIRQKWETLARSTVAYC